MKHSCSKITLIFVSAFLLSVHFFYYPKWEQKDTEATLSWDVSGYYLYLPAAFIYKDLRQLAFKDSLLRKYRPTPDFQQGFLHPSGNYVMKYPLGQALQYAPFFFIAHGWASLSTRYPADGFSFPYQLLISLGSLFYALLGLFFLRKILLFYFPDKAAALTLLAIAVGSNYLDYAAIDGAMTHNYLFTIYSILIYLSIRFYQSPDLKKAAGIGFLVGLAALTRPTEIISLLIPLLWGLDIFRKPALRERLRFFKTHRRAPGLAILICVLTGSLQLFYWHHASGDWIVYSYQDQGFSWLNPHIKNGLFSYKSGWLTYTPLMIFALAGFYPLFRDQRKLFFSVFLFTVLFIYIAFAWDIWWYGGSLGQRSMVQAYPVLAFPLTAFFARFLRMAPGWKLLLAWPLLLFTALNLFFTHQAHKGGLLPVGQVTRAYYWQALLRNDHDPEKRKLLDEVKSLFDGKRENVRKIFSDNSRQVLLNSENQSSEEITVPLLSDTARFDWLRVSVHVSIEEKEWNFWTMTQFIVEFGNGEETVAGSMMRLQRQLHRGEEKDIYLDLPRPEKAFDRIVIKFWNAGGNKEIRIRNIKAEIFDEKK